MEDKIKNSYHLSKNFYDNYLSQSKWWIRLYFRIFWEGVDDNEIARRVLEYIPSDFSGRLLDVPVGTAIFTIEKYKQLCNANITCLDYSYDMLEQAVRRFTQAGICNIKSMQGDVGYMSFENNYFDYVLSMNGLHVFPDKQKAYDEIFRVLKPGGFFIGCFYVAGESRISDWLVNNILARKGWFTPPFDKANEIQSRLNKYATDIEFNLEGPMCYFRCKKRV